MKWKKIYQEHGQSQFSTGFCKEPLLFIEYEQLPFLDFVETVQRSIWDAFIIAGDIYLIVQ
jgi:hypothetical protein